MGNRNSLVSIFHYNNKLLTLTPINYTRADTKNFQSTLTLLDFLLLLQNISHKIAGKNG